MIDLDTPKGWGKYTDYGRCLAVVKKFSNGKIAVKYHSDTRQENSSEKEKLHIKQDSINDKGLIFCTKSKFRKIELSPFGKVIRKHRKLSNGKKEKVKQSK
jgi:hypothetical protein